MDTLFYLIIASAEHAAGSSAEHTAPSFFDMVIHANVINIVIAFALIFWLVKRYNLLAGLDSAQKKIIEDLRNSEKSKGDAIKELKEAEERLSKAKDEADQIIEKAEVLASKIKADIIAEAEKDAERIMLQAKKTIENEKEVARAEIQKNLTLAAVEVARDNIKNSLDDNWHRQIIQNFVENLSNVKVK